MPPEITLAQAALAYAAELGWAVFPLKPRDKTPLVGTGFKEATTNADQIAAWWEKWPDANIGVATGGVSGIVVVDVDGPEAEVALAGFGGLPATPVSLTGRGRHLVFARGDADVRNSAGKLGTHLDVRGDGGYIVVPPSVHPSGHRYQWQRGAHPLHVSLAPLPEAILSRLRAPQVVGHVGPPTDPLATTAHTIPLASAIGDGQRNQTLAEYAGRLLAKGHGELETLNLLLAVNEQKCTPPLPRDEVERIVASIGAAERRKPSRDWRWEPREERDADAGPRVEFTPIGVDVLDTMAAKNVAPIDAVPTMLPEWNDACRGYGGGEGLARGWHVTVGGASGTGKSLFALNLVASALKHGRNVAYVSLEMSKEQLLSRLLALVSRTSVRELEPGRLYSRLSWERACAAYAEMVRLAGSRLTIADRPTSELSGLVPTMRQAAADGATLIVIDYVQLIQCRGTDSIFERTFRVSQALQRVAFDCNVVTLALSQFNRTTSFNKDAPPSPESLTGGSALENDSDQVILLDHSANKRMGSRMETNVIVAKNRHGPVPCIPVVWDYTTLELRARTPNPGESVERRYGI